MLGVVFDALHSPSPPHVDSGLRRNDERGAGMTFGGWIVDWGVGMTIGSAASRKLVSRVVAGIYSHSNDELGRQPSIGAFFGG